RDVLKARGWEIVERAAGVMKGQAALDSILQIHERERVSHSFPLLRVLQLGDTLSRRERGEALSRTKDLTSIRETLFERVHLHLSESEMPASAFDAADLVFSLEGWILSTAVVPDF